MKKFLLKLITPLLLIYSTCAYASDSVVLVADYWCPYNCEPNSENEGILIDIARIAFAKKGIKVDYQIQSWSKAVDDFNNSRIDGVIGAIQGDVENPVFPSVEQANGMVSAFTLKNTTWVYDGPNSMNNKVLGIIEAYTYANDVKAYIYSNYIAKPENFIFSTAENAMEDNISKLQKGEIFVYIEDENVVSMYMKENNITNIRNAGNVQPKPDKIYIAFPKDHPKADEYAKLITDTTFELKSSGKLSQMNKKYGIKNYK
jgi:polar amino acid transport system substrate-binding protein